MWLYEVAEFDQMKNMPKVGCYGFWSGLQERIPENVCWSLGMDWTSAHHFWKRKSKTFAGAIWKTSRTRRFMILLLSRDFSVAADSTLKSTPGGYQVWESTQIPCNAWNSCRIRFWISNLSYACRYLSCFMNYIVSYSTLWPDTLISNITSHVIVSLWNSSMLSWSTPMTNVPTFLPKHLTNQDLTFYYW